MSSPGPFSRSHRSDCSIIYSSIFEGSTGSPKPHSERRTLVKFLLWQHTTIFLFIELEKIQSVLSQRTCSVILFVRESSEGRRSVVRPTCSVILFVRESYEGRQSVVRPTCSVILFVRESSEGRRSVVRTTSDVTPTARDL